VPILPTPFQADGSIDEAGMRQTIRYVLAAGAHGVAFPAMASEFYSLTDAERVRLTELVVHEVGKAVPVVGTATAQSGYSAVELAQSIERAGVDAIMVMPPYVVRDGLPGVTSLFSRLAATVDVPLILQNAPAPLGSAYGVDAIRQLMEKVPQVSYLKEETMPGGQKISRLLDSPPASLQGVFGGAGGRYIIDELNRGAIGAMPACEITEVHVRIFDLYREGDPAGARALYNRSLPLLTFQAVFRMDMTKEVLRRRGVIESPLVRVGSVPLDEQDHKELSVLLAEIEDLLLVPAAA
jgi:dihydrodipicolinate synthase/N-acetylneuraminate lyase